MRACLLLLLISSVAAAQKAAPEVVDSGQGVAERIDTTRLRIGLGLWGGGGVVPAPVAGAGLSLHVGVQLNDGWAVFALVQAETMLLTSLATASVMAERTFFDHVSVGIGGGAVTTNRNCGPGGGRCNPTAVVGGFWGVNMPLRLAFNFGPTGPSIAQRHRFYIALDGGLGFVSGGSYARQVSMVPGAYGGLGFGYTMM